MDVETILLTEDQQTELREWTQMLNTPGWARFSQQAERMAEMLKANIITGAGSMEEVQFYRGQLARVEEVVNLEASLELYFQSLTQAAEEKAEELEEAAGANA